jgi:ATP-binding cassette subfamily F protein 3
MSVITVRDLTVTFGATEIFGGVSFTLEPRQRLAVVGGNGAGKSSLLEVITGHLPPTAGTVDLPAATRLAYLPQELVAPAAATVYEEALASRQDLLQLRRELTELEQRMATPNAFGLPRLLERYGDEQHRYEQLGGYDLEHRTRAVLGGLGFSESDQGQPPGQLSGGQQRRLGLAKLLLQDANVLLLDEPTNHLDLAAIEWLEEFLRVSPAAMLVVSHDRRFLDKVADHVLELAGGRGESYPGNYSRYVRLRAERRARRQVEYEAQQAHIAHQEAFIQRYRAGQRAREARGRQKQLDRLARVERPHEPEQINLRLKAAESSQHVLESSTGLTFGFPGQALGHVPPFTIAAGERVAIVGPNGVGKTTLLRTLMGERAALKGKLRLGARVKLRYYDQHLGDLDPTNTVVEELQSAHPLPAEAARNFLARLLFTGDDAFKKVASLSGGEKSRVALAKLMLDNANLLLLDEPTNHLDIPSQEVLEEALGDYPGTIIFVSHDRYFIDRIATAVWRLEAGGLQAYAGNYTNSQKIRARQGAVAPAPTKVAPAKAAPGKRRDARERATVQLEQEIEALEQQLGTIEHALADGRTYDQAERVAQLTHEFEALSQTLQERYRAWEDLANPA